MNKMNLREKFLGLLFNIIMIPGLIFGFGFSLNRTYNNIINLNNIKKGIVINSEITIHNTSDGGDLISNVSSIKLFSENLTLKSTNYFESKKGDTVKVRYVGTKENNIIFEVNGKVIASKYDFWDYASPFNILLLGYLIYVMYLTSYVAMIKKRFFKYFIILCFFSINANLYSQELSCSNSPYLSFEANNFKIHQYSPVFVAKKVYSSLSEVKNDFPEALVESEMSVISQEWSSFNYGKTRVAEPLRYEAIRKMDTSKNYSNLLYKVQYQVNGEEYSIIKLHIYSEEKKEPMGYALSMKKKGNKWIIYDESAITELMFMMIFLKTETLSAIFNQQKTTNTALNKLIETSKVAGVFNLNKLLFSVKKTLETNRQSLESILDPYCIFK
jgi:hypothetical protein